MTTPPDVAADLTRTLFGLGLRRFSSTVLFRCQPEVGGFTVTVYDHPRRRLLAVARIERADLGFVWPVAAEQLHQFVVSGASEIVDVLAEQFPDLVGA